MSDQRRPRRPSIIRSIALLALAGGCASGEPLAPSAQHGGKHEGNAATAPAPSTASAPAASGGSSAGAALLAAFRCGAAPDRAARLAARAGSLLDGLTAAWTAAAEPAAPTEAAAPAPCGSSDAPVAALAWEVHLIQGDGRSLWVDAAVERFGVGDRVLIRFATSLPGIVEASSPGADGRTTRLGTWSVTLPSVERVPRAGAIELVQPGDDERITLSFTPCRFAPAAPAAPTAWSPAILAALPLCVATPAEIDPRRTPPRQAAPGRAPSVMIEDRTSYVLMPLQRDGARGPRLVAPVRLQRRAATS